RDGQPVELHAGRYGPYVKHRTTNATLPDKDAVDTLTLEEAVALVDAKAGREAPATRRAVKPRAARKTPTVASEPDAPAIAPRGARTAGSRKAPAATKKVPATRKTAAATKKVPATTKTPAAAKKTAATRKTTVASKTAAGTPAGAPATGARKPAGPRATRTTRR
ncbi:MAG: topoisomerase C-terminal repeat-containing protein, partial [Casimicrobiaceae bacterium]